MLMNFIKRNHLRQISKKVMYAIPTILENYAALHTTKADTLLQEVLEYSAKHSEAHMVSGNMQGQFLQLLSTIARPKYILEVGTFTGYSALCLAKGLQQDGEIHTIELRHEDAKNAAVFFAKSKEANKIKLHIGDALNVIPTLNYTWDLVFIDADKVNYSNYYDLILPNVKQGGIIIADNVLFHGQVLEEPIKGKNAIAIAAFNQKIKADERIDKVMLTIRDGLLIMLKK
jgi:predicted O-methyltransferase YrrM